MSNKEDEILVEIRSKGNSGECTISENLIDRLRQAPRHEQMIAINELKEFFDAAIVALQRELATPDDLH